nr:DUF5058 family protein [uncultured Peptoniphilus sp.]
MHTSVVKAGSKDTPIIDLALSVLVVGMMSVFVPVQFVKSKVHAGTLIISAIFTILCSYLSKKLNWKWMDDFVMSLPCNRDDCRSYICKFRMVIL